MTDKQLLQAIMDYWTKAAIEGTAETDRKVNNLIYDFAIARGIDQEKIESDVFVTVSNLTASNKRKLYKLLLSSSIVEA